MNLLVERLMFPFATICFLLSSLWVGSSQAQESASASYFNGGGEINLIWNHTLPATGILSYSEVETNAEVFEEGAAIADAVAESGESLLDTSDTGGVSTAVAIDGIVSSARALSYSRSKAHNFFLLKNTSDERVIVNFNWSANWLVSGAIDQHETDRSGMTLRLTLAKSRLKYGSHEKAIRTMARRLKGKMTRKNNKWRGHKYRRHFGKIFSKYAAIRLPTEGRENYDSGGVSDEFEVTFDPKQSYLFGVSAEASGLATVSIEGCSAKFWKRHRRAWSIHPNTKFSDVFGIGPEDMSLWVALRKPRLKVDKPKFFRNAVAALLNARSSRIAYYIDDVDTLKSLVKRTFESDDLDEIEAITDELKFHNRVGASHVCESALL